MSAAIILNPCEIKQIFQPTVISSRLLVLARRAEALATLVEKEWQNFSPEERNLLEAIIYTSIAERSGILSLISSFRVRLSLAWILIRGETDALVDYLKALQRLKNTVLRAIENEHPEYEQKMTEALLEAIAESDNSSEADSRRFP